MCFVHDYDHTCEVWEESAGLASERTRCDECRAYIHAGEWRRNVEYREYEECRACYEEDCECPKDEDDPGVHECVCAEPAYGESGEYDTCERCDKVLRAIKAAEEDEGCKGDETQPGVGELREALLYDDGGRYIDRTLAMFPELAMSGHLRRLWVVFDPAAEWETADLEKPEVYGGEG